MGCDYCRRPRGCVVGCQWCNNDLEPVFKVGDKVEHAWLPGLYILIDRGENPHSFRWAVKFQSGEQILLQTTNLTLVHGHVHIDR